METTKPEETSIQTVSEETKTSVRPEYSGDKGDYLFNFVRDTPIERKPVATFSYGQRVRIAALYQEYEKMLDHIV